MPFDLSPSGGGAMFDHLGFGDFDLFALSIMAGRLLIAALLGALLAYRPWRRFMHWHFEPTESGAQTLIAVAGALMTTVIINAGEYAGALAFALVGLGGAFVSARASRIRAKPASCSS